MSGYSNSEQIAAAQTAAAVDASVVTADPPADVTPSTPLTDDEAVALAQTETLGGVAHLDHEADDDNPRGRKRK